MAGIPTESPLVLRESLGSSNNHLISAEDYEEAGYPPVGLLDASNIYAGACAHHGVGAPSPLDRGRWLASLRRCESNLLCRRCGLLPRCRRLLPARFRLSLLPTSLIPFRRGFRLGNLS